MKLPTFMDTRDVAFELGVSRKTAQRWVLAGRFGAYVDLGRKGLRVWRSGFLAGMEKMAIPAPRRPSR